MEFNGTFFATIISFLVFVFIMNRLLYAPIRNIVCLRNNVINDNYKTADENNAKAEELTEKMTADIAEAREEAREKYNELLGEFKEQRIDKLRTAKNQSAEKLESVYAELENVSNEVKTNLKFRITDLANDIVEKVLGCRSDAQGFNNDEIDKILYH